MSKGYRKEDNPKTLREDTPIQATAIVAGVVELATDAEVQGGASTTRVVTPSGLATLTSTTTRAGLVEKATPDEINAGAINKFIDAAGLLSALDLDTEGDDWSVTLPGGLILNFGKRSWSSTDLTELETVTFSKEFSSLGGIVATPLCPAGIPSSIIRYQGNSSFTYNISTSDNSGTITGFCYVAWGV